MTITCILCPNSCELDVVEKNNKLEIIGYLCLKGKDFAIAEFKNPHRTVCSTVKTKFKDFPRLPVKTDSPIPKNYIFKVMNEINKYKLNNRIKIGDVLIKNIAKTNTNLISTDEIPNIGDYNE